MSADDRTVIWSVVFSAIAATAAAFVYGYYPRPLDAKDICLLYFGLPVAVIAAGTIPIAWRKSR